MIRYTNQHIDIVSEHRAQNINQNAGIRLRASHLPPVCSQPRLKAANNNIHSLATSYKVINDISLKTLLIDYARVCVCVRVYVYMCV